MSKSMRLSAGAFVLFCQGWTAMASAESAPATADPATADLSSHCESRAPEFGDERTVTCTFAAPGGADQRFLFRVNFLGSHDDTKLSMTAALNQQPLECGPGSKTSSRFEDGEVALECRFTVSAARGAKQVLAMAIVWTHAQYADFSFSAAK